MSKSSNLEITYMINILLLLLLLFFVNELDIRFSDVNNNIILTSKIFWPVLNILITIAYFLIALYNIISTLILIQSNWKLNFLVLKNGFQLF
jgi:hypothetical protein